MTQQALFINDAHPGIVQLLSIWQIAQALQIKRHEEFFRRHEGVRCTTPGTARTRGDEIPRMQSSNQIPADLFTKKCPSARHA